MNRAGLALQVLFFAACFPLHLCGQPDPAALLLRARAKIVENVEKLPNYTCVQTVSRSRYELLSGHRPGGCGETRESADQPKRLLAWSDRFKLDVTVVGGAELFSWAGAREFESSDAQEIVGDGLTGTGDFGRFLLSIFGAEAAEHQFLGWERSRGQEFALYRYRVPTSTSHYSIKLGAKSEALATLAYEGRFWIDANSAELKKLTIVVPQPPSNSQTCRIETTIDYQPVPIGGSRLLLPELTLLRLWDADGTRYENQTTYAACRAFQSESVFRPELEAGGAPETEKAAPDEAPGKTRVPSGLTVEIVLRTAIAEETASAGDAIEGELLQPLRARGKSILAPEGTLVHGRIVRFERHFSPARYFLLGLEFDSLEVTGRNVPLNLELVTRSREQQLVNGPLERRQHIGVFLFPSRRLALPHGFLSQWKTASAPRSTHGKDQR